MMSICPISIVLLLLLLVVGVEGMRWVVLGRLLELRLLLPIVRHWLHLRHLMVGLREELAVRLVLLVAHVCHCIPVSIRLLLVALL